MTELSTEVETEALGSVWLVWDHTGEPHSKSPGARALPNLGDNKSVSPGQGPAQQIGMTKPSQYSKHSRKAAEFTGLGHFFPGSPPEETLGTWGSGLGGSSWTEGCLHLALHHLE